MTLAEIRDWLRTMDAAEHYSVGRLDNGKEKSLAVYDRPRYGQPVTALGGPERSSYDVKGVSLLLHWNRNARETEAAAQALWDRLLRAAHIDTPDGGHIQFIRPESPAPVGVGTDESGVYEYVIEMNIYYRR